MLLSALFSFLYCNEVIYLYSILLIGPYWSLTVLLNGFTRGYEGQICFCTYLWWIELCGNKPWVQPAYSEKISIWACLNNESTDLIFLFLSMITIKQMKINLILILLELIQKPAPTKYHSIYNASCTYVHKCFCKKS